MNRDDILSGEAGTAGIQWILHSPASRRLLRGEVQRMLRPGYRLGSFDLTRVKFKPGRKLLAYFTFPVLDSQGQASQTVHLAVVWRKTLDDGEHADDQPQLHEEAEQAGLMPVQCELWRNIPEQGMTLQIWPFDLKFPRLVRLGNPAHVARMLDSLGIVHDLKLPVITPIRYRPGERHVLRYEIDSPDVAPGQGTRLYAKLYSHADDAARAFGVANRVVDWLDANNLGLGGNRPEALSKEDGVILYPHAPGIPLSHLLHRSRQWLGTQLQIIGRALASLHNGPETLQADLRQNNFHDEAKVVKRASEHIQILLPDTYNQILETLTDAQEQYTRLPQEKPTFTHSDFKADHLLYTPEGLTLIDFDTCTLTDPALDLGKFLADLDWWFARKGISGVEEAQAQLLQGYTGQGHVDPDIRERLRRARLFHVLILVKIAARRAPLHKKDWAATTARMVKRANEVLHKKVEA
jgi:hypothetical protein